METAVPATGVSRGFLSSCPWCFSPGRGPHTAPECFSPEGRHDLPKFPLKDLLITLRWNRRRECVPALFSVFSGGPGSLFGILLQGRNKYCPPSRLWPILPYSLSLHYCGDIGIMQELWTSHPPVFLCVCVWSADFQMNLCYKEKRSSQSIFSLEICPN